MKTGTAFIIRLFPLCMSGTGLFLLVLIDLVDVVALKDLQDLLGQFVVDGPVGHLIDLVQHLLYVPGMPLKTCVERVEYVFGQVSSLSLQEGLLHQHIRAQDKRTHIAL